MTHSRNRAFSKASQGNLGFTLIELLIVLAIIGLVIVFVVVMFWIAMAMLHPHG